MVCVMQTTPRCDARQGRSQGINLRGAKLNVKLIKFHHIHWHRNLIFVDAI